MTKKQKILLGLIIILASVLRFWEFWKNDLWQDEVGVWLAALSGVETLHDGPMTSFLYGLFMGVARSAEPHIFIIPNILAGIGVVVMAFIAAQKISGTRVALIFSLLFALSPLALFQSQEIRPYALLLIFLLLACMCFLKAMENPHLNKWDFYFFGAVSLCCLTHLLISPFMVVFYILRGYGFIKSKSWASLIRFLFYGTAVFFISILWFTTRNPNNMLRVVDVTYYYGPVDFTAKIIRYMGSIVNFNNSYPIIAMSPMWILAALYGYGLYRTEKNGHANLLAFSILTPIIFFGFLYFNMGLKSDWQWMRYVSPGLIPYYWMVAVAVDALLARFKSRSAIIIGFIVFMFVPGILVYAQKRYLFIHSKRFKIANDEINENKDQLNGVIYSNFNTRSHTRRRFVALNYLYKKNDLPAYLMGYKILVPIKQMESRYKIQKIPSFNLGPNNRLVDVDPPFQKGRYALYPLEFNPDKACFILERMIKNHQPDTQSWVFRQITDRRHKLFYCEIE